MLVRFWQGALRKLGIVGYAPTTFSLFKGVISQMAETKVKGDLGQVMAMADLMKQGYKIAMPYGEDWAYDLIAVKGKEFIRIQVKYTESDGKVVKVKARSTNNWSDKRYTADDIDYIAVYDLTTNNIYYVKSDLLGDGVTQLSLRLVPSENNQKKGVRMARDYMRL